jgi:single-strand DNA-binding protein
MRYTGTGKAVTRFPIATNRSWLNGEGQRVEATEWHHIAVWGTLAETCNEHLRKGQRVYVQGRLQTRSYPHPEHEEVTLSRTEIVADRLLFLVNGNGHRDVPVPEDEDAHALAGA